MFDAEVIILPLVFCRNIAKSTRSLHYVCLKKCVATPDIVSFAFFLFNADLFAHNQCIFFSPNIEKEFNNLWIGVDKIFCWENMIFVWLTCKAKLRRTLNQKEFKKDTLYLDIFNQEINQNVNVSTFYWLTEVLWV